MNAVFILSILLKGLGAVLEVGLQILITRQLGVSGYGTFSTWINGADLIFWVLFSGLVKCNTFYLSGGNTSIDGFRRKYYGAYVLPVLAVLALGAGWVTGSAGCWMVLVITGLELAVMDQSSALIARGRAGVSLFGEYLLGRLILIAGAAVLSVMGELNLTALILLYAVQYACVLVFFRWKQGKGTYSDISERVSLKKWGAYQRGDIMQSMIGQMPVVLQFFFAGGFEAGVVSIVLLVKKLINFISGPTAKVFLPEFSRLYRAGDTEGIRSGFAGIMRMQMLFVGPMAVVLAGFPDVVLGILAPELREYRHLFVACSLVFLVAATLGPCGGVMQMTGNEKMDNRFREAALLAMAAGMAVCIRDRLFVLYGLCIQTTVEAVGKYLFLCRWMGRGPVALRQYGLWWIAPAAAIVAARSLGLHQSFWWMLVLAAAVFALGLLREWRSPDSGLRTILHRGTK